MPRTMSLLAYGDPAGKRLVRIVVFGQSISGQPWWKQLADELSAGFPAAEIEVTNTAIAGFSAPQLIRTLEHCVYPYYPDLVIFHDFGGKQTGEWERIIREIRKNTSADILVWTDHRGHGGERGSEGYASRLAREDRESDAIRYVASKYNCELADVREGWNAHLDANGLEPKSFLKDNVHLNEEGNALLASLLLQTFTPASEAPAGWTDRVRSYEAKRSDDYGADDEITFSGRPWRKLGAAAVGESPEDALHLDFRGNRVDLIPVLFDDGEGPATLGTARVLIDGVPPSEHPLLYGYTLPSRAHGADWQPAIRRVTFRRRPLDEEWTLKIFDINEDATRFRFEVAGTQTGPDGGGVFDGTKYPFSKFGAIEDYRGDEEYPDVFVSESGRVVIDHRDFKITWAQQYSGEPCPEGFEVRWKTIRLHQDLYAPPRAHERVIRPITVACGLSPGTHHLQLVPNGDGPVPIDRVEVHRPPLAEARS